MNPTFPLRSAFLALPLEGTAREAFVAVQQSLGFAAEALSFQPPDTPHLTLVFWQSLLEIEYHQVLVQAPKIAGAVAPFALQVTGADTFGERGEDRVLFLTVEFSPPLADLKKRCPWPQAQPFHPHITLARVRHPQRFVRLKKEVMKALKDVGFSIEIDRLRLYGNVDSRKQTPLEDVILRGT